MTAAWEQQQKPFLTVCVPHLGQVPIEWAFSILHLRTPPRTIWSLTSGAPIDISRSQMVQKALESGSEWVMMADSDIIFPPNTIEKLLSWNLPICSALYYRRYPRGEAPAGREFHAAAWRLVPKGIEIKCPTCGMIQTSKGKYTPILDPPDGLFEVDVTGAGALLVHHRVFEKIREKFPQPDFKIYPWFSWKQGWDVGGVEGCSEDFEFLILARDAGFKVFCDGSIKCGHAFMGKVVHPGRVVHAMI